MASAVTARPPYAGFVDPLLNRNVGLSFELEIAFLGVAAVVTLERAIPGPVRLPVLVPFHEGLNVHGALLRGSLFAHRDLTVAFCWLNDDRNIVTDSCKDHDQARFRVAINVAAQNPGNVRLTYAAPGAYRPTRGTTSRGSAPR